MIHPPRSQRTILILRILRTNIINIASAASARNLIVFSRNYGHTGNVAKGSLLSSIGTKNQLIAWEFPCNAVVSHSQPHVIRICPWEVMGLNSRRPNWAPDQVVERCLWLVQLPPYLSLPGEHKGALGTFSILDLRDSDLFRRRMWHTTSSNLKWTTM
jgi:hypothetical protein